jgi:hypothetical protein
MKSSRYWGLYIYALRPDGWSAPGSLWIYFPKNSGSSEFRVCDTTTNSVVGSYDTIQAAVDAALCNVVGNVHFAISRGTVSDSRILISEQHPISTAQEWEAGTSFVTPVGIDQSKEEFIEYLDVVLRSNPPLLRTGCRTMLSIVFKFVIMITVVLLLIRACSD